MSPNKVIVKTKTTTATERQLEPNKYAQDEEDTSGIASEAPSAKQVWADFLAKTSLHGCNNIQDKSRRRLSRWTWGVMVLGSLISLILILHHFLTMFLERPFITKWSLIRDDIISVPEFKICLFGTGDSQKAKQPNDPVLDYWLNMITNQNTTRSASMKKLLSETPGSYIIEQISFTTEDVFKRVLINTDRKGFRSTSTSIFQKSLVDMYMNFKECWNFNDGRKLRMHEGDIFDITINPLTRRLMHDMSSSAAGIYLETKSKSSPVGQIIGFRPGTINYLSFAKTRIKFLPDPYNSMKPLSCVHNSVLKQKYPLLTTPKYSQVSCQVEERFKLVTEICNCSFGPFITALNVSECSVVQLEDCFVVQAKNETILSIIVTEQRCPMPCFYASYNLDVSSVDFIPPRTKSSSQENTTSSNNLTLEGNSVDDIIIYLTPRAMEVTRLEHVPEITLLDICSQVSNLCQTE